jgi:hypothetical protein
MKKLLSIAAVAAIVTSAFAFTTKGVASFCVRSGNACQVINNKKIEEGLVNFKHYPLGAGQWDGSNANCVNAGIANCSVDIRLVND